MKRRVAIVTGSRAEFGLLTPVIRAVQAHPDLVARVVAAGSHLLPPAETWRDVAAECEIAARVEMQTPGELGRAADARAVGGGISGFAGVFESLRPDWVVVLGDRIEAFAAASAASIGGWALAHLHGGDRAEGIADEAMRHAMTKLAHLHFAATPTSAGRIVRMGEAPEFVHVVGSPAIDGLSAIAPLVDQEFMALRAPDTVFLMHPRGGTAKVEETAARRALEALQGRRVLCLMPNADAGREGIVRAIESSAREQGWPVREHLPREKFVGLLKRLAAGGGVLVGNSSAGLIECAALKLPAVDLGPRQGGRERSENVVHDPGDDFGAIRRAVERAEALERASITHPFGDGRAGERVADRLGRADPSLESMLRKRCTY